jgi:hypothetical protein
VVLLDSWLRVPVDSRMVFADSPGTRGGRKTNGTTALTNIAMAIIDIAPW